MVSVSARPHALSHVSNNHCSTTLSFCSCLTQFSFAYIRVYRVSLSFVLSSTRPRIDRLMSQKSNPIWEYFSEVDSNASKAKCGACDKLLLSLGSDNPLKMAHAPFDPWYMYMGLNTIWKKCTKTWKEKERKWTCIAPIVSITRPLSAQMWITQELPANTPHLPFLRISIR